MIPEEYKSLPRLAGYAKVEIIVDSNEGFNKYGAIYIKDAVPLDLCKFLTNVLLRAPCVSYGCAKGDEQIPNAYSVVSHEIIFDY